MANNVDETILSLITLAFLTISSLCWLVLRYLKEGRQALKEINKYKS